MPLNTEQISSLLEPKLRKISRPEVEKEPRRFPAIEQHGPLRYYDIEMRCLKKTVGGDNFTRTCGSPTHFKLQGVAYCMIHCLVQMNELLIGKGVHGSDTDC
jgi:hypothetical protein